MTILAHRRRFKCSWALFTVAAVAPGCRWATFVVGLRVLVNLAAGERVNLQNSLS